MKELGKKARLMASESYTTLMETFMKENGSMIRLTAEVPTLMLTELSMTES